MRHRLTLLTALAILVCGARGLTQPAPTRPLKVLLLYDMEGASTITELNQTRFAYPEPYRHGREGLTSDVNAAIAGLTAAGVTDIVVVDGHASSNANEPDVFEDRLLAPAKMISRDGPFDIYAESYDHSFDAVVAVGMHAGAGNRSGFVSHTYTGVVADYRVNGVPFNESMVLAMNAARLKIPVIMISGDDQLEREVRRNLPWVEYAVVKHAVERSKAEPLEPGLASRRIEAAVRAAVGKLASPPSLPQVAAPCRFAITFQDEAQARNAALLPGAELLPGSATVQFRTNDFEEGYNLSWRMLALAGSIARQTLLQAVMDGAPDAAVLRQRMFDWNGERFLGRISPPAAPPAGVPPGGRQRYWGAR